MADGAGIDIASLGVRFDTSQVRQGTADFKENVKAGKDLETQVQKVGAAEAQLAKSAREANAVHQAATQALSAEQRAYVAVSAAQTQAASTSQGMSRAVTSLTRGMTGMGSSADGAVASLLRFVPTLGPIGLALAGVAAAAGLLYKAWSVGEASALGYQRAVSGVGRTAGLTAIELRNLTVAAAEQGDISIKSAQQQATAYLKTGQVGRESLRTLIAIGKDYASFMGIDATEATKSLARAMEEPDKAARELTRATGLLTQEQIKQIDAAVKAGDANRAQKILLDELTVAVHNHAQQVPEITSAWDAVTRSISNAIQKLGEFLYVTKDERLAALNAGIDRAKRDHAAPAFITSLTAKRDALAADLSNQQQRAAATASQAAANQTAQRIADATPRARRPREAPRDTSAERTAQLEALVARALAEELQARLAITKDIQERADLEKQVLTAELTLKQANLAKLAADIADDKGLNDPAKKARLAELKVVEETEKRAAALQVRAIDDATADALAKQALDIANAQRDGQAQVLEAQLVLATRAQERGEIEAKLLSLADERTKAELDGVIAAKGSTATQVAIAQAQLATLEATKGAREEAQRRKTAIAGAEEIVDELAQIDSLAVQAGQSLEAAFGRAGGALGGLLISLTGFRVQMAQINKEELSGAKTAQQAARQRAAVQVQTYGDMAGAAKSFFKEGTAGYKALEAAEMAYRAIEFAMAVKSIFFKGAETAATVANAGASIASDATTTASTVATSAVKAAAHGVVAVARAIASLPFPLNLAAGAATAAALVAYGVKLTGGGGGGAGVNVSEERQRTQGTGSVLGDSKAKSESIAHSLELVASNTNRDLEYANGMLRALRSIDSNIGALTGQLAKELNVGGAFDQGSLGLGSSFSRNAIGSVFSTLPVIGDFLGNLFGTKKTTALVDQGLTFDPQTVGSAVTGGLQGSTFSTTQTTKKKKFLGIVTGTSTSTNTDEDPLNADISSELNRVVASLRDGVLAAASALGVEGAQATLDAFTINLGTISFKDKTGSEIQTELEAVFSKLGDDMAAAAIPGLSALQKVGEGAFETMARVAREYQVVDVALQSIGKSFGAVGVASLAARDDLVQLTGGLDEFASATAQFADDFLTEAERMAPIQHAVSAELARLGVTGVNTKDEFKRLVLSLDLTTQSGREMYAALLAVAPAFAKVADYITEGSKAINEARDALSAAYERESDALLGTIDRFRQFSASLSEFRESLYTGANALLSPEAQYQVAKSKFEDTSRRAALGDEGALGDLQKVSQAYLEASRQYYASSGQYFADLAKVRDAVEAAEMTATRTADNAEQQLDALKASVAGLIEINESVLSVHDAILQLQALLSAQAGASTTPFTPTSPSGAPLVTTLPVGTPVAANDPGAYPAIDPVTTTADQPEQTIIGQVLDGLSASRDGVQRLLTDSLQWQLQREGMTAYASGGAFGPGGVVTKPTAFNTGSGPATMGEAGDEGILPLANIGGKLGVYSSGGSDPELKVLLQKVIDLLETGNANDGRLAEAITTTDSENTGRVVRALQDSGVLDRLTSGGKAA